MTITTEILKSASDKYYIGKSGCLYDKESMNKAMKEYMAREEKYGCVHNSYDTKMDISISDVSHKVTTTEITDDGDIKVSAKILDTPQGNIVRSIMDMHTTPLELVPTWYGSCLDDGTYAVTSIRSFDIKQSK